MKYLSIDIETTGLDPERHQILSFGAIIEDTNNPLPFEEIPKFYKVFKDDIKALADPFALAMNRDVLLEIAKGGDNWIASCTLGRHLQEFLFENGFNFNDSITLAGKNLEAFDLKFLNKIRWLEKYDSYNNFYFDKLTVHRRVIDPSTLFVDWTKDKELPNLKTCKERAGIEGEVCHNALQDAWDVIQVLRTKY